MKRFGRQRRTLFGSFSGIALLVALAVFGVAASSGSAAGKGVPQNTSPPTVSGTPQQGQTLSGTRGTWSDAPTDYNDFWVRCDSTGGSCANISGANARTYLLKGVDVGNTIRFKVQAKNADGSSATSSVPTAVITAAVKAPPPVTNGCASSGASIPIANITSPAHLTIDQTQISPSTVLFSTRAITVRFHVSGCGGSVDGALVYVTAVPYGQFAIPNEQPTGSDGWATLQFSAMAGYPVSNKQQLLVMFARARKPGENILGGVSTRRLVSFHVARG
jgi:hypothetical protein